jgi:hypothetical protein
LAERIGGRAPAQAPRIRHVLACGLCCILLKNHPCLILSNAMVEAAKYDTQQKSGLLLHLVADHL